MPYTQCQSVQPGMRGRNGAAGTRVEKMSRPTECGLKKEDTMKRAFVSILMALALAGGALAVAPVSHAETPSLDSIQAP